MIPILSVLSVAVPLMAASSGLGDLFDDNLCGRQRPRCCAAGVALIATVFAAVYNAEVVAHRIGRPFGTLVLAR